MSNQALPPRIWWILLLQSFSRTHWEFHVLLIDHSSCCKSSLFLFNLALEKLFLLLGFTSHVKLLISAPSLGKGKTVSCLPFYVLCFSLNFYFSHSTFSSPSSSPFSFSYPSPSPCPFNIIIYNFVQTYPGSWGNAFLLFFSKLLMSRVWILNLRHIYLLSHIIKSLNLPGHMYTDIQHINILN